MNRSRVNFGTPGVSRPRRLGMPSGSGRRLGAVAEPVAETVAPDRTAELLETVVPLVRAVVDPSVTQSVSVLEAKIRNQTALAAKSPEPIRTLYLNNVAVLKAKLAVARKREARDESTRASASQWSFLGKTFTLGGIAVAGAAVFALVMVGKSYGRKGASA